MPQRRLLFKDGLEYAKTCDGPGVRCVRTKTFSVFDRKVTIPSSFQRTN